MMKSAAFLASLITSIASAEIVLPVGGGQGEASFAYEHPSLRSLVFISPESRQMAILPPSPVFLMTPPLLMRVPATIPAYPPVTGYPGFNVSSHPSNRDTTTYNLQRAHNFSQDVYREGVSPYGDQAYGYGWLGYGSNYPPAAAPGFNQPARPSNRDNTTYNLERAHRFSMDTYRKP